MTTLKNVEKFGHTTSGTVDGPGNLERPLHIPLVIHILPDMKY